MSESLVPQGFPEYFCIESELFPSGAEKKSYCYDSVTAYTYPDRTAKTLLEDGAVVYEPPDHSPIYLEIDNWGAYWAARYS